MSNINIEYANEIVKKLNTKNIDKTQFLGIFCEIVYSKELFNKNKYIADFLRSTMNLVLPDYVIRSRTLMTARTIKYIYMLSDTHEISAIQKKALTLLNEYLKENTKIDIQKENTKKKKNENDKLKAWLEGL